LPPEITTARLIRKKKPWALSAAALLLVALALSTIGYAHVWGNVSKERFSSAESKADGFVSAKSGMKTAYEGAKTKNAAYRKELSDLVVAGSQRVPWLEVLKAVNECLPRDITMEQQAQDNPELKNRIRILSITAKQYSDVGEWYKSLNETSKDRLRSQKDGRKNPDDKEKGPTGPGFVFTLQGRHFHNEPDIEMRLVPYVANTLLRNLKQWEVPQLDPVQYGPTGVMIPVRKIGITHATITDSRPKRNVLFYKNGPGAAAARAAGGVSGDGPMPVARGGMRRGGEGTMAGHGVGRGPRLGGPAKSKKPPVADPGNPDEIQQIPLTDFVIEFVWQDKPESKREAVDPNPIELPAGVAGPNGMAGAVVSGMHGAAAGTPAGTQPAGGFPPAQGHGPGPQHGVAAPAGVPGGGQKPN
jgi:type IV pilus assembly protein PilM